MPVFSVHAAKTNLSKLLEQVERGEEVIIARRSKPVAMLVRVTPKPVPTFGALKGKARVTSAFFEPLPPGFDGLE